MEILSHAQGCAVAWTFVYKVGKARHILLSPYAVRIRSHTVENPILSVYYDAYLGGGF